MPRHLCAEVGELLYSYTTFSVISYRHTHALILLRQANLQVAYTEYDNDPEWLGGREGTTGLCSSQLAAPSSSGIGYTACVSFAPTIPGNGP